MENYDFLDEDEEEAKMSAPTPAAKRPLKAAKGFAQYTTETKVRTVKVVDEKARRQHILRRRRKWLLRVAVFGYVALVAAACVIFAIFGCTCEDSGTCGDFTLAKDIGIGWCIATGGAVSVHLYTTLPMTMWISRYYDYKLAIRLLAAGAALGVSIALLLALVIQGKDPPPGYGLSGVPTGAALVAGFGAWLLFSVSTFGGYYRNKVLGTTCTVAVGYLVASIGVGILASFELHVALGVAVAAVLLFVLGWTAQVWVTTSKLRLSLLAWLAPLVVGAGAGVTIEYLPGRFGMPPVSGYAIGLGASVLATVALSHAYETRGVNGARNIAGLLMIQDVIGLASWTSGYQLHWASGVLMLAALEAMLAASISVANREGNQFGLWQGFYPLALLLIFCTLLRTIYESDWASTVVTGTAVCVVASFLVYLGFRRSGVLWGMRFIFITFLCIVQANLMMIEFVVVRMPAPFAIGFGSVGFVLLLGALLALFKYDDGSGKLYGSGVEGLFFVMTAQVLTYASGLVLYSVLGATDADSHIAAGLLGSIVLICPTLTQYLAANAQNAKRNFNRGFVVAGTLAALWIAAVLLLRFLGDMRMAFAIQICSAYTICFIIVMCLAILRFLATALLVYLIYLVTAIGAVALVFSSYTPFVPVAIVSIFSVLGLGLPLVIVWPLARQRADMREDLQISRFAERLRSLEAQEREEKAAKPTGHRAKHVAKAKKLEARAAHGNMPKLLELSHSGVVERAGTVRWCHSSSDGRPILPFTPQTVVCRGSFLYLFAADGELMPTTRALSAIPLYKARVLTIPEHYDDRLPALKSMIDLRLSIPWRGKLRLYLQFRDDQQMRIWAADLERRSHEDSSHSAFREALTEQATRPDPSLAEGMLAVRKAMMKAASEEERAGLSKGIIKGMTPVPVGALDAMDELEKGGGRSDDPIWAGGGGDSGHSGGRRVRFQGPPRGGQGQPQHILGETVARMGARQPVKTRIGRAVRRKEEREAHQELCATSVFSSVVCYTPRGTSGTSDDLTLHYPEERRRYPSLAASAREAAVLNAKIDEDELRQYNDWLAGKGERPSDAIIEKY